MHEVGVRKVRGSHEEGLEAPVGAGNHSRVISEEESAENGHKDYKEKVGFGARIAI